MSRKWLIENGAFLVLDQACPIINGYMLIEDDLIQYVGETRPQVEEGIQIMDGSGLLFMPGLINTHGHSPMSLLRGLSDDVALQVWLQQKIWPMEAKFSEQEISAGAALSILEMIKGGTTTFLDMYIYMDEVASLVEQTGIRAVLTRGVLGMCSKQEQLEKLAGAVSFAKEWNHAADGRITTMLSPHSPYTCPPALIHKFVEAAHDLGVSLHTHMSETKLEVQQCITDYGVPPAQHLQHLGFFSRPALVAHGVHVNSEEIQLLATHKVSVAHNPGSNLKLASGIAPVVQMLEVGVNVSLGTDSAASNNNLDMFEEMNLAALIHKGVSGDPTAVPAVEALKMGTEYGAKALGLSHIGSLSAGKKADFIALSLQQAHFVPKSDLLSHLIYSAGAQDVEHVWVNGVQLVRHKECLTMDEEKICYEAEAALKRIS